MTSQNEIMKKFNDEDFELKFSHENPNQILEVIRLNGFGTTKDMPKPYKYLGHIVVKTKNNGIIPFYRIKKNNDVFELFELTYAAYCKYGF